MSKRPLLPLEARLAISQAVKKALAKRSVQKKLHAPRGKYRPRRPKEDSDASS